MAWQSEEISERITRAAKSADICAECAAPLEPMDSVTMGNRRVHIAAYQHPLGMHVKAHNKIVRVPICIHCSLTSEDGSVYWRKRCLMEEITHRGRCLGCARPMRLRLRGRWHRLRKLTDRTCCDDCRRTAVRHYDRERHRVKHEPRPCAACGNEFTPKRSDAITCSNRCRQRAFRQRVVAPAATRQPSP
jgi:hypothetical protein